MILGIDVHEVTGVEEGMDIRATRRKLSKVLKN